jgi:transcription antitermination factor NusG
VLRRVGVLPGYVFAKPGFDVDFEAVLRRVVGAIDVARMDSGKPLFIADRDLAVIRKIAIGLNAPRPDKLQHDFKRGEKVWFIDDILNMWPPGRIEKLASDGRISVEVALMGRKVPIWVLPHQIERRKHRPA